MLKNVYFILLICVATLSSCSKKDQTPDTLQKDMSKDWSIRFYTTTVYDAAGKEVSSKTLYGHPTDIFSFTEAGTWATTVDNLPAISKSGTYKTSSLTAFSFKDATTTYRGTVISLSPNDFVFKIALPKVAGQNYTEYVYTLN